MDVHGNGEKRWRRKSPQERSADRRRARYARFNPIPPLVIALSLATLIVGMWVIFGSARSGRAPMALDRAMVMLPVLALLIIVSTYLWQCITGFRLFGPRSTLSVCPRCFDIQVWRGAERCECGGWLENAHAWVPDRCPTCSYDLRASDDACPECGQRISPARR